MQVSGPTCDAAARQDQLLIWSRVSGVETLEFCLASESPVVYPIFCKPSESLQRSTHPLTDCRFFLRTQVPFSSSPLPHTLRAREYQK